MTPLQKLQEKIGVEPDGSFGPITLKAAMIYFKMSPERISHFCGQTAHETGGFTKFNENLNYSVNGLKNVFRKYFPDDLAEQYARNPEKIGSRVYANRMGNGDESSKEGYFFRGRGALQTTGKNNYKELSEYLNNPEIMTNPDIVATDFAFESAIFFFDKNKLWSICDKGVTRELIVKLTRRINGGTNGLADRIEKTNKYYDWLTK
jgi:putative chitinase